MRVGRAAGDEGMRYAGDEVRIPGASATGRYRKHDAVHLYPCKYCPVCGGIGITWKGWFNCDSYCEAKAVVSTGETFVPIKNQAILYRRMPRT